MRATDLLHECLRGLLSLSGAEGVSLYLPSFPGDFAKASLSHAGDSAALPELAQIERAEQFRREIAPQLRQLRQESPGVTAVEVGSSAAGGHLIGLLTRREVHVPERRQARAEAEEEAAPRSMPAEPLPDDLWLGLRLGQRERFNHPNLAPLQAPPGTARALEGGWAWLLDFAAKLALHNRYVSEILDDPVTGLPCRAEFQVQLEHAIERARREKRPVTLLMVNPDDFGILNTRMSRAAMDAAIGEIAQRLSDSQRSGDLVARYGGVVFATILADTDSQGGVRRAEEILRRLHERAYLDASLGMSFSLGVACREPRDDGVRRGLDLVRRANLALNAAKREGGGRLSTWRPGAEDEVGYLDRLLGVFTGQTAKDYRNMALLSDTVSVVAGTTKFQVLAARVVKGLAAAMKPDEVGLFEWTPAGEPQLIFGLSRSQTADAGLELVEGLTIDHEGRLLLEQARSRKRAVEGPESVRSGGDALAFAVPLLAGSDFLGVLYLAGRTTSISLDSSDLVFLEALATQVAVALDRARLAEQQRLREEQERIRLLDEVEKLRAALGRTRLLHLSASMETLLGTVRQVAPTDATVLITGESGTGKEVVARVVHTLSRRHDRPFVVVDCGAIPTTLIESELFGHEKGAFTGAQQRQVGRLVEAHGGTLLLDEIGELPLEAQTKLLRFVQEKQVRAMGGGAARTVDVRILAATNRELLAEVQAGRFRADLYHRLNVVRLEVPPLRARPDDILLLARHFIGTHEVSYGKGPLSVSKDAEALLLRHSWPGNVRELQNRLMRAVILCQGSVITPADLDLSESASAPGATNDAIRGSEALNERAEIRDASGRAKSTRSVAPSEDGIWQDLRDGLGRQIEKALENAAASPPPLGRWLAEDLVLEAEGAAGGVASRAAALLGMPETTFRRQLEGSAGRVKAGWSPRPADWQAVRAVLARLVRLGEAIGGSLPKQAQQVLLEEVLARLPHEPGKAAALLGVTLPTFRRRGAGPASPSRRDSS